MIISASRRTDIPAFYARWFIKRVRAGFCEVPNPFNPAQVSHVSLAPEDVDAIVFWTRNPRPLFPYLRELDERGYRYYFQYTLLDYPPEIDAHNPPAAAAIATMHALAARIGPQRIIWRYDPIVLTGLTPPDYHRRSYARLAQALEGIAGRSVISFMDTYGKARRRFSEMGRRGAPLTWSKENLPDLGSPPPEWVGELARDLAAIAAAHSLSIQSCAETLDLQAYGVQPGKCIDDGLVREVFGLNVTHTKDPSQRKACGCVISKDIGMYDACLFGCSYCYATGSFDRARHNYSLHDPDGASILPRRKDKS